MNTEGSDNGWSNENGSSCDDCTEDDCPIDIISVEDVLYGNALNGDWSNTFASCIKEKDAFLDKRFMSVGSTMLSPYKFQIWM